MANQPQGTRVVTRSYERKIRKGSSTDGSKTHLTTYSSELIFSSGHPYYNLDRSNHGDIGGAFNVVTRTLGGEPYFITGVSATGAHFSVPMYGYWGSDITNVNFPKVPPLKPENTYNVAGAHAVNRMIPTTAKADVATFAGELREGLPKIPLKGLSAAIKSSGRLPKGQYASGQYLNYQFGITPLQNDLVGFYDAVKNSRRDWNQLKKKAGKVQRASYYFPSTNTVDFKTYDFYQSLDPRLPFLRGTITKRTSTHSRMYVKGAFRYFLPKSKLGQNIRRLDYQYGIIPKPSTVWQLTPWGWMADWFVNAGETLENIEYLARDSLVMPYMYLMEEQSTTYTYTMTNMRASIASQWKEIELPTSITTHFTTHRKYRISANPYGFGLKWDNLSLRQLSILGALGINRKRTS